MSVQMREYETMVSREIESAGGQILEWGTDGRSHRTVTFELRGKRERFHFPSSGRTNGCGLKNGRARLRRTIKALIPVETPATKEESEVLVSDVLELAQPVTMNKARRREIALRYLEVQSIEAICEEFDLYYDEAVRAIKLGGAAAARAVKKEISMRVAAERAIQNLIDGKPVKLPKKVKETLTMASEAMEAQEAAETQPEKTDKRSSWKDDVPQTYAEKFPGTTVRLDDGFQIDIPCIGCGETHEAAYVADKAEPPYKVLKNLRDAGWKIGETTQRYSCPRHTDKPADADTATDLGTVQDTEESEAPKAERVTERTPATVRAARRAVIHWLDECFDLKHNCYKAGMSDDTIAAEVGLLHPSEVAAIREDLYGPLGPPEEFVEILQRIEQIDKDIDSMTATFTEQVAEMTRNVTALRREFEERAKAAGWME